MHFSENMRKNEPESHISTVVPWPRANPGLDHLLASLEAEPRLRKYLLHAVGGPVGSPSIGKERAASKVPPEVVRDLGRQLNLRKDAVQSRRGQISAMQKTTDNSIESFPQVQEDKCVVDGLSSTPLLKHSNHV